MIENLGIVIVVYNPDLKDFMNNLNNYVESARAIVIIDNSENPFIGDYLSDFVNIHYIALNSNVGIAKAQNIGIDYLISVNNIENVLFFDQDSYLTEIQVNNLVQTLKLIPKDEKIGLVSPGTSENKEKISMEKEVISSGSLIPVSSIMIVGKMREEFFIDFVDYEWCWRARSLGYGIYSNNSIILSHQTDNPTLVMGKVVSKPFRDYFFYRNVIYLMRNKMMIDSKKMFMYKIFKHTIFELFFCKDKIQRFKYIMHGINDGINKKMGKLS